MTLNVYALIREAASENGNVEEIARAAIWALKPEDQHQLLIQLLAHAIDRERRAIAARIEHRAARLDRAENRRHREAHNLAKYGEAHPDAGRMLREAIEEFRRDIRLELTAELLASQFALGDGHRVTWGAASVEDHRQRVALLLAGVEGNIQTIAMHEEAIALLERTGALMLSLVQEADLAA